MPSCGVQQLFWTWFSSEIDISQMAGDICRPGGRVESRKRKFNTSAHRLPLAFRTDERGGYPTEQSVDDQRRAELDRGHDVVVPWQVDRDES